jgi:hypothetical protein
MPASTIYGAQWPSRSVAAHTRNADLIGSDVDRRPPRLFVRWWHGSRTEQGAVTRVA